MIGIDIKVQRRSSATSASISSAGAMLNARAENWGHDVPSLNTWAWLVTAHARRLVRIRNRVWLRTHVYALPSDIEAERCAGPNATGAPARC